MNGQGAGGGHTHDVADVPSTPPPRRILDAQLAQTGALIEQYPTVADAEAAGYFRAGPFAPGLGAHYNPRSVGQHRRPDGPRGPRRPDADLRRHRARLAAGRVHVHGVLGRHRDPPEGFAGPNDHWHYHTNVCMRPARTAASTPRSAPTPRRRRRSATSTAGS